MLKRRLLALLLVLAMVAAPVFAAAQPPYAIKVNRACNTVTVYGLDEQGQYTVPVKAMICSTARPGHTTPLGSYRLAEYRSEWRLMLDGTYGQYATCFSGHYLFHSICYSDDSHDAMVRTAYNNLGNAASMGCVRLETADAKWIFDNCPAGTPVTVYDDPEYPGPLGKPEKTVSYITEDMYNGWDPTDPAEGNPWRQQKTVIGDVTYLDLLSEAWYYPEVVQALESGLLRGAGQGRFDPNGSMTRAMVVQVLYNLAGQPKAEEPVFADVAPDAWYAAAVAWATEKGIVSGLGSLTFAPDQSTTRQDLAVVLWRYAGKPKGKGDLTYFSDAETVADYAAEAMAWMNGAGLLHGSGGRLLPKGTATRAETAAIFQRAVTAEILK